MKSQAENLIENVAHVNDSNHETFRLIESVEYVPIYMLDGRNCVRSPEEEGRLGPLPSSISVCALTPYDILKRVFDLTAAILSIIFLSPLLLVLAFTVKVSSRGPIFFKQMRVGKGGKQFFMYKFRSMCCNAESLKDGLKLANEADGPAFKIKRDPRITPLGFILRKYSLDELPQLWNIVRGEMSFVGPRPPLLEEVKQYKKWQAQRLSVTPGLTCIWQISGRNHIKFDDWMRMDIRYIRARSLWLDLVLILKSFSVVLKGTGAY